MTTITETRPAELRGHRRSPTATLALTEAKLFMREPIALFWGVVFPLVLLIVIGSTSSDKASKQYGGLRFIDVYVPVLMVFVLTIVAVNALPAVLASYRDKGYLRRLATTPVGARRLLGVQLGLNLAVVAAAMVVIVIVATDRVRRAAPAGRRRVGGRARADRGRDARSRRARRGGLPQPSGSPG